MILENAWRRVAARGPRRVFLLELLFAFQRYVSRAGRTVLWRYGYGVCLGRGCYVGEKTRFVYPANIAIGDDVTISEGVELWSESPSGSLVLYDKTQIGRHAKLDFSGGLTIGRGTLLSEGVLLYTHDHGYDPHSRPNCAPLEIGEDVWIGARAIVLPSVRKIGNGAVIGAGALVTREIASGQVFVADGGRQLPKKEDLPR